MTERDALGADARCRAVLRVFPAWYRAERGEEIAGTLLDLREAAVPVRAELWSLVALGMRTRLAGRRGPGRGLPLGDLVRALAVLGLFWGLLRSVCRVGESVWTLAVLAPEAPMLRAGAVADLARYSGFALAALIPLVLLADGWRRAARAAAAVLLAAGSAWFLVRHSPGSAWYYAPQWFPLVLVLAGFPAGAPRLPSRLSWWAVGGGVLAAGLSGFFTWFELGEVHLAGNSPLIWLWAGAGAGYLALRRRGSAATALALAVCIALVLVQTLVVKGTLLDFHLLEIVQLSLACAVVAALATVGVVRSVRAAG